MDHVTFKASITRLRSKPLVVHVGRLDIDVYERPHEAAASSSNSSSTAIGGGPQPPEAAAAAAVAAAAAAVTPPRAYKLTDRILEGMRVEIGEVRIRLRTLGRRKCPRVGAWSPPDGLWVLRKVVLSTVDEEGLEVVDLEEAWAYNKARLTRRRRARRAAERAQQQQQQPQPQQHHQPKQRLEEEEEDYFLFKRLLVESLAFYVLPRSPASHRYSEAGGSIGSGSGSGIGCGIGCGSEGGDDSDAGLRLVVPETPVECRFAIRRALHDVARCLGFEMDLKVSWRGAAGRAGKARLYTYVSKLD